MAKVSLNSRKLLTTSRPLCLVALTCVCVAVFGVGGSAPLCEACSNDIHQTTTDSAEMIHQVQANRQLLKEQVKKAMDDFKQLLYASSHTVPLVLS